MPPTPLVAVTLSVEFDTNLQMVDASDGQLKDIGLIVPGASINNEKARFNWIVSSAGSVSVTCGAMNFVPVASLEAGGIHIIQSFDNPVANMFRFIMPVLSSSFTPLNNTLTGTVVFLLFYCQRLL